jgi:hypothetical protein
LAENADDLFFARSRHSEQAKSIFAISMAHFAFQFLGQIGDDQRIVRALVDADPATDAKWLANQRFA